MRGVLAICLLLLSGPLLAQDRADTPQDIIPELFALPSDRVAFTDAFLNAVPEAELERFLAAIGAEIGPIRDVTQWDDETYVARTDSHSVEIQLTLDPSGAVAGLFVRTPRQLLDAEHALDVVAGAELGTVSWWIEQDGVVRFQRLSGDQIHLGSAFKPAVLAAVIRQGYDLADVVRLRDRHISHPTGDLRLMPIGAPFTVYTLAAAMISQSDNTATDMLMDLVGAEAVADILGVDHVLTTRAFFQLKADSALRAAYLDDPNQVQSQLEQMPLPPLGDAMSLTHTEGFGWQASPSRLCAVLDELAGHPDAAAIMALNPGPARRTEWSEISFKGGSEVGVLTLANRLVDQTGGVTCAVMSVVSDRSVDTELATAAWGDVLSALSRELEVQ